jgi:hypothetical protein
MGRTCLDLSGDSGFRGEYGVHPLSAPLMVKRITKKLDGGYHAQAILFAAQGLEFAIGFTKH